jgi:phage tail sheath protein FI
MALNVGVNVLEVDGRAPPTLQGAPTSVAAFLGKTTRGPLNSPVLVSNPQQFRDRFGDNRPDGYLAYAVDGFFLNGGSQAYVCRVAGSTTTSATLTLKNRASGTAGNALTLTAGYLGSADPGLWGNRLRIDVLDDPRAKTQLASDLTNNAASAVVASLRGIQAGTVVQLAGKTADGNAHTAVRKVTKVDAPNRTISWDSGSPVTDKLTAATTQITTLEFRLVVGYRPSDAADLAVVEDWGGLSMEPDVANYVVGVLNHPLTGSRYVTATDLYTGSPPGLDVKNPAVVSSKALTDATEGDPGQNDFVPLDSAAKTGVYAFDRVAVQLLAIPDVHKLSDAARKAVVHGALGYCVGRDDCTFVGSAPDRGALSGTVARSPADYTEAETDYVNDIQNYAADFQAAKVYGALYFPWIQVTDPIGTGPAPALFVPGDGHVMGVYARTDAQSGIFKAPAGFAAQVMGALDVSATFTDGENTDLVRNGLVNGIRPTPGAGIIVATSRTLSSDTRWWFVNVRLLFNYVKSTLKIGLRFVRQEPHTDELRRAVRLNVVTPFLLGLWRQGAFGSDPPAKTFTVKCDAENNPPSEVDLGNFHLDVYFYPARPVETILITVGQQPDGGSAAEA